MTILSAQSIRKIQPVEPFNERTKFEGCSFGLSSCGYDVRIDQDLILRPQDFVLASTVERFNMPRNLMGMVADKSTWIRQGVTVHNTIIEPNWRGCLTLELKNSNPWDTIKIPKGVGIAQIIFLWLDFETDMPYEGKYQDQESGPQQARFEF